MRHFVVAFLFNYFEIEIYVTEIKLKGIFPFGKKTIFMLLSFCETEYPTISIC